MIRTLQPTSIQLLVLQEKTPIPFKVKHPKSLMGIISRDVTPIGSQSDLSLRRMQPHKMHINCKRNAQHSLIA